MLTETITTRVSTLVAPLELDAVQRERRARRAAGSVALRRPNDKCATFFASLDELRLRLFVPLDRRLIHHEDQRFVWTRLLDRFDELHQRRKIKSVERSQLQRSGSVALD